MAFPDYVYLDGTISVTKGQKAFTGKDTAWQLRKAIGAIVIVGNSLNFVASLSTEKAGEFLDPFNGPTQADVSYRMWLVTSEAATILASGTRLAQIIASIERAQPESPVLSALASLVLSANKILYSTGKDTFGLSDMTPAARSFLGLAMAPDKFAYSAGPNAMALADLTPAGRALIDDVSASAQLDTLGFSAFAKSIIDDVTGAAMWSTLGGTQALSANGYVKLPNGLIIQWGMVTITGGDLSVVLPIAFPNVTYAVLISPAQSNPNAGVSYYGASADQATLSSFAAHGRFAANGGVVGVAAISCTFLAIGR